MRLHRAEGTLLRAVSDLHLDTVQNAMLVRLDMWVDRSSEVQAEREGGS
jgi:hypothetical protein